jgi:hypothetical protein
VALQVNAVVLVEEWPDRAGTDPIGFASEVTRQIFDRGRVLCEPLMGTFQTPFDGEPLREA